jgi:hypothetical protein
MQDPKDNFFEEGGDVVEVRGSSLLVTEAVPTNGCLFWQNLVAPSTSTAAPRRRSTGEEAEGIVYSHLKTFTFHSFYRTARHTNSTTTVSEPIFLGHFVVEAWSITSDVKGFPPYIKPGATVHIERHDSRSAAEKDA